MSKGVDGDIDHDNNPLAVHVCCNGRSDWRLHAIPLSLSAGELSTERSDNAWTESVDTGVWRTLTVTTRRAVTTNGLINGGIYNG